MLEENGLIEYQSLFKLFAAFTGGRDKIVAGTFTLNTDMDYRALISGMSANSATKATVKVTIPEGYSIDQIFALLEEKGVVSDTAKLEEEAANHDYAFSFLQDLPLGDYHRLEGYLYPDTYEFTTPQNPLYVINKMLVRFDAKLTEELRQQIADSGRTIHEVLTVASLIEKETDGADRADIASVIYNRLNNPNSSAGTNGYLQIDATLAYLNGSKVPTEADQVHRLPLQHLPLSGAPPRSHLQPGDRVHPGGHQPQQHLLLLLCAGRRQPPPLLQHLPGDAELHVHPGHVQPQLTHTRRRAPEHLRGPISGGIRLGTKEH